MQKRTSLAVLLMLPLWAQAELKALDDESLASVTGAGFGLVIEDFLYDGTNATITINDITNSTGQNVPISVKELYVGATGSNKGSNLNPVDIGRLSYPWTLDLVKGENLKTFRDDGQLVQTLPTNLSVLSFAAPSKIFGAGGQACVSGFAAAGNNCSMRSTEKVDAGVRFDFNVTGSRTDVINMDFTELTMDGSYLRLWGDTARQQLVGEARINLYAKTLEILSCATGTSGCTSAQEQAARTIYFTNTYAQYALGYGKSQPLLFDVTSNGQFVLELPNPVAGISNSTTRNQVAADFYANAPRTNILIDNLNFGGTRASATAVPTGGYNFGRNEISGLSFNYLKVSSHDL
ncbi:DUF6160 family protein [Atopomonas sediminilitoris]|uniref:DUF6160 family protein n=1 Tax=Atopomonas sediminilitoris TaxID=2919919 RepID=UPI001F4D50D0|nr:DUF6160 family protein [Atopomonas sediminilitoris]MCJ8170024.1 hypothetical protein [Atopomonas sediminilitoris]